MKKLFLLLVGFSCTLAAAMAAFVSAADEPPAQDSRVRTGMEMLLTLPYSGWLQNQRIGVLAHHASRVPDGTHLVDVLVRNFPGQLKMIFAPEHGFRTESDTLLPDSTDPVTGLPVYSLYGPRRAPTMDQLAKLDVLIIDLQDVGVRYYTYATTMALAMKACKQAGKKVIILDRPNPIGGSIVEGAVLESSLQGGFAAYYPIATRHAMTLGELARLFNDAFHIDSDLKVVPLSGWNRTMYWDETGLPWFSPSPALPSFEQTLLYGLFGTLEDLNIAVGRGITNENAFRKFGAPWITTKESAALVSRLNALQLLGLQFVQTQWTPTRREFEGQLCNGFEIRITDHSRLQGVASLLEILRTMRSLFGKRLDLNHIDAGLGARWIREGIENGTPTATLLQRISDESRLFLNQRAAALIY